MSLIIKKNTTFKIPRDPILWKIAIFGAGTTTSNGEYVWDGVTLESGKPKYISTNGNYIYWSTTYWSIWDFDLDRATYISYGNLTSWEIDDASEPLPTSTLSYVQDSFISSITLVEAGAINSNGTFSRTSGGSTQFDKAGSPNHIFDDGNWVIADFSTGTDPYASSNYIFNWSAQQPQFEPPPIVSSIIYST
jgi:hypothetical protein